MPVYLRAVANNLPVERALPTLLVRQRIDDDDEQNQVDSLISRLLPSPTTTTGRAFPTVTRSDEDDSDNETTTTRGRTSTSSNRSTTSRSTRQVAPTVVTPPPPLPPATETLTTTSRLVDGSNASGANNAANNEEQQTTGSQGLSGIAIGTIVAASVIFGLICLALIARKIFQARRRAKRTTWVAGNIAPYEQGLTETEKQPEYSATAAAAANVSAAAYARQQAPQAPSAPAQYPSYSPAPAPAVAQFSPAAPSSTGFNGPYSGPVASSNEVCIVKMTFRPSLPDELPIVKGESVRVLTRHDDGWAICEKVDGGQRGAVPVDCLEPTRTAGRY